MFLINFGASSPNAVFRDVSSSTKGRLGACLLASGFDSGQLVRNSLPSTDVLLLDPQLYLAGLPRSDEDNRIWRLASHSWFGVEEIVEFDSGYQRKREWQAEVKGIALDKWSSRAPLDPSTHAEAAIRCQMDIACSMVILPTPLLRAREDEGAPAVEWIRAGVKAARKLSCEVPLLATIALDEVVLNDAAFDHLGYLDALVSQISACNGIHGVYIVVAQTGESRHPFKTTGVVYRTYAALCRRLRAAGRVDVVLPNFCDAGGFVCVAHGASGFANGNFQSTRRLTLSPGAEGRPYPFYYTHAGAAELRPEDDLDALAAQNLLSPVSERTVFSGALLAAVKLTGTAAGQGPWLMTINNVAHAHRHQVQRFCEITYDLLASSGGRYDAVERWLIRAEALQAKMVEVLDQEKTRYLAPAGLMLKALRDA